MNVPEITYRMLVSDNRTGKERTLRFTTTADQDTAVKRVEHHARVTVLDVEVESGQN